MASSTSCFFFSFFFFNDPATTEIYTLSLHDALPIYHRQDRGKRGQHHRAGAPDRGLDDRLLAGQAVRSEEHTSELQSRRDLVCRLLLEKKKNKKNIKHKHTPVQDTATIANQHDTNFS